MDTNPNSPPLVANVKDAFQLLVFTIVVYQAAKGLKALFHDLNEAIDRWATTPET